MTSKAVSSNTRSSSRLQSKKSPSIIPTSTPRVTRATANRSAAVGTPGPTASGSSPLKSRLRLVPKLKQSDEISGAHGISLKHTAEPFAGSKTDVQGFSEPIKAFLRIRPKAGDEPSSSNPYLKVVSSTAVQMLDIASGFRHRIPANSQSVYTFSHVFQPDTPQSIFFAETALDLVRNFLLGSNGLLFTYGVTNSGKTYTIQGGKDPESVGLLPRTLDAIFNSLDGLHSNLPYRPCQLSSVEKVDGSFKESFKFLDASDSSSFLDASTSTAPSVQETDAPVIDVDRNYEYSVWISYVEVYNEKVFDLLADDDEPPPTTSKIPRSNASKYLGRSASTWQSLISLASSASSGDVPLVKRKALVLKNDANGGKYIASLKDVRVRTAEEAKAVFKTGNANRQVFGTLINSASSRSHGIFTIKILKINKEAPNDMDQIICSRLSIVDLAGSERSKNTKTTGERLKEAGNINKSLMVLGQCMEALRNNQRRQQALSNQARTPLTPYGKISIVPFRHSKLTEIFQDFFTGEREGRAIMIVNVNPYDTGFDENSHVMRFAALAREVRMNTAPENKAKPNKQAVLKRTANRTTTAQAVPNVRRVTLTIGSGQNQSEAMVDIVEEDEDQEDEEPIDLLVEALFDEMEDLRIQLYESEMRCAVIEAETREEVMKEMEERMLAMEKKFALRLRKEVERNEMKTDAKIDILHRFGAFASSENIEDSGSPFSLSTTTTVSDDYIDEVRSSGSESPFPRICPGPGELGYVPGPIGLTDDQMGIDEIDADETMTQSAVSESELGVDDDDAEETDDEEEEEDEIDILEEDEWVPSEPEDGNSAMKTPRKTSRETKGVTEEDLVRSARKVSELREQMAQLRLNGSQNSHRSK